MIFTLITTNSRRRNRLHTTLLRRRLRQFAFPGLVVMIALGIGLHADACRGGDAITVAVMEFEDTSPESTFPKCNRALQSFLTTDIAQCGDIVVVERARIDQVVKELKLADTGLLDPKQAATIGKMLMADAVLLGSIWVAGEEIRLDARLIHVATGSVILGEKIEGVPSKFSALEKQLAGKLVESLGIKLSAFQKASFERTHTESLKAANLFGLALDAEEQGDASGARAFAQEAAAVDPDFEAARNIVKAVDALLAGLRNERTQRQVLVIHEFEDHVLHASLSEGGFGPNDFTALVKEGKPDLALFRWLIRIRGAIDHEDQAMAFDDSYPGKKAWPYRSLFAKPGPLMRDSDGIVSDCYFEMGAAEELLFWCDVALSDDRFAPRTPLTEKQINPDWRTLPARGLSRAYFYPYMLDILTQRMRAQVSLKADYTSGLTTAHEIDRLCRPWLDQQWLLGQLEQMRDVSNDSRAFAQATRRAREATLRWKPLEQDILFYHHALQELRFGAHVPYSEKTTLAAERKRFFPLLHKQRNLLVPSSVESTEAYANSLVEQAHGKDFVAYPCGEVMVNSAKSMRWVVHVTGCADSVSPAPRTARLPADDPRGPRGLDDADLCLQDLVVPCSKCRPCRWVNDDQLRKKLLARVPFLIRAIDQPNVDEELIIWYEEELLGLLWAFCDSPTPGLNEPLRALCQRECKSDRHDREYQAMALQCVGKAPRPEDADWLVNLYDDALPFDCRANIAAALGSLGGKSIQQTLEAWIEREPYYFVRHSLQASLSRSRQTTWQARIDEILRDFSPNLADDAISSLSAIAQEGSRTPVIGRVERLIIGQVHLHLGDLCNTAGRSAKEQDSHYRKAISLAEEDSFLMASALNALAYSLALQRSALDEAEAAVRKALAIVDFRVKDGAVFDDTHMLDTLAVVLMERGQLEDAKQVATTCVSRPAGQSLEFYEHLGDILSALDDAAGAKAAWEKGLTLADDTDSEKHRVIAVQEKLARQSEITGSASRD